MKLSPKRAVYRASHGHDNDNCTEIDRGTMRTANVYKSLACVATTATLAFSCATGREDMKGGPDDRQRPRRGTSKVSGVVSSIANDLVTLTNTGSKIARVSLSQRTQCYRVAAADLSEVAAGSWIRVEPISGHSSRVRAKTIRIYATEPGMPEPWATDDAGPGNPPDGNRRGGNPPSGGDGPGMPPNGNGGGAWTTASRAGPRP